MGPKEESISGHQEETDTTTDKNSISDAAQTLVSEKRTTKKCGIHEKPSLKIDEILSKIGGFGRYQLFLVLCLGLGGSLYTSIQNLSITFVESPALWRCVTSRCSDQQVTINGANRTLGTRTHYDLQLLCSLSLQKEDWTWVNTNHTSISDFGQACGSQTIITKVLYFWPGVLIGGLIFGMMGFSTGRKTPFLSALLTSMVASVISAASREYILFMVLRMLLGSSIAGYELLFFCWSLEFVARKWRPLALAILGVFWSIGLLLVFYINEKWEYWRYKVVYVGILSLIFIFVYAVVPESPYWLLAKSQDDTCSTVLKRIAALNGKSYPDVQVAIPSIKGREKVLSFFKPRYHRIGVFMCLNWLFVGMVYYHIFLSLHLFGNETVDEPISTLIKTNYIIAVGVEIPAAFLGACLLCNILGRRLTFIVNVIGFAGFAALSLLQYEIMEGWPMDRVALLMGAKLTITGAKLILALWTVELAPTTIRALFFGLCLGASATGVMIASGFAFFAVPHLYLVVVMVSCAGLCVLGSTQIKDTSLWDLSNNLSDVYKYINNTDPLYSDLPSEQATAL